MFRVLGHPGQTNVRVNLVAAYRSKIGEFTAQDG